MLMHQGIGLEAFNAMPERKALHALYECCNSVTLAGDLVAGRPYADHDALFRRADALLFELSDAAVDRLLETCPHVGRRPHSDKSAAEQCALWDEDAAVMAQLNEAVTRYEDKFGFGFVMYIGGLAGTEVLAAITDRLHHDPETERKVVRNELARIARSRLERMLGPEGGYQNW
ncbi:2-oxo-4-hydroxy-4-carboxy-5-ureidoimidazoline decarboxylase [Mycolicibacterium palauense]|uniref:2-oxo-4-hydroxy-4-carboxy-5-ureidoimidazoline decarboxylase n=1 Tax=Mycolicibacterium palauense TaxID=2034511 RepID=UPI001FEAB2F0|nr:2-oxo-4-hydroxy-4-carboxy-5-ureidoimidazoline decarboxylase [Mycolicibacterium palauense]